jgi:mannose-6-phosphate isomerase
MKPDATLESFKRAIADGTAENCLQHVPLREGEAVFVPAGTAHTIGPGLVLCEIQEHSDLTYRVYDYNRRDAKGRARDLHIDKALDVMRFGKQTCGKTQPARIEREPVTETHFVACKYFATERWDFSRSIDASASPEHFDLIVFLEGSGCIAWGNQRAEYAPAQVWMIPAALGEYQLAPEAPTSLLRTYVPGDLAEFSRRLAAGGVPEPAVARIVHC